MTKEPRKQLYEGMYIISSTLSEDARTKALERVTESVTSRGGEINKVHELGRKKLAYEINGRKEGYYYLIYFTVGANVISELWSEYHLNEDLVRFMTLRADEVDETLEFNSLVQE